MSGGIVLNRSSAAKTALWSLVESAGMALVSFASLVVYSRFLTPADFGLFSMVLALVELLGVLVSMLFHDALVQRADVSAEHFDTAFTFSMGLSLALLAASVVFAPAFAHWVKNPAASRVLMFTALCFPCNAISATIVPRLRRKLEFRALAVRSVLGRISGALLGIPLVVLGARFWGLVAQYVLVALVGSLVLWVATDERPRLRFRFAVFRSLLRFGVFSVSALFLNFAVGRIFTIVIGVTLGATAAGYLNLSFRAVDVLWAVAATAVSQVALPLLARLQADPARLKRAYSLALEFTCLTLYPCFIGIALVAPEIVEVVFGRAWLVSSPFVAVLGLLVIVRAPRQLGRPLLSAVGRPQDSLVGNVLDVVVMTILMGVSRVRSLPWAMTVWAGREVLPTLAMAYVLKRATSIGYLDQLRGTFTALVSSASMIASVCLARALLPASAAPMTRLSLLVPLGAVTFLGVAWLFDRASIVGVIDFVLSARRGSVQPAAPAE